MRKKTIEKMNQIKTMYEAGKSLEDIAEATGYKVSSVSQYLPRAGIIRRKSIENSRQQIIQMRLEGKTLEEISKSTGFGSSRICQFLRKNGFLKKRVIVDSDRNWEEEVDESQLTYAEPEKEKPERITVNGTRYVTVPLSQICGM